MRHTMLLHEVLEKAPCTLCIFRNVVLQLGYRHGAHIGHCVGGRERYTQREPFDVTIKLAREKERGLQCRCHKIMLFNGNKNCSELHGVFPSDLRLNQLSPSAERLAW